MMIVMLSVSQSHKSEFYVETMVEDSQNLFEENRTRTKNKDEWEMQW